MTAEYNIINNESNHHFELLLPDEPAYIQYSIRGDVLALYYIFVPPEQRGKGLSSILIEYALDFAKKRELKLEVYCSYIKRYLEVMEEKGVRGKEVKRLGG